MNGRPEAPYVINFVLWGTVYGIWFLWNKARDDSDEKAVLCSLSWPETQGTVTSSRLKWAHVEVRYDYSVGGTRYIGEYNVAVGIAIRARGAAQFGMAANRYIAEFPPGKKIIVRFNPFQPSESVYFCSGEVTRKNSPLRQRET